MYDPLRIAVAVEGPTDSILMEAILASILQDVEFELQTLQPEGSVAFGASSFGGPGVGWVGVYRWSRQAASEGGGSVSGSSVFANHDLLVVHVDADVAEKRYSDGNISDAEFDDLPCVESCPPPDRTTDALRAVVLSWLGERACPSRIVMCTPSKNIEAWLLVAVWPDNNVIRRGNWECRRNPEHQLRALPRNRRFERSPDDYKSQMATLTESWRHVSETLTEAARFERELRNGVADQLEVS